MVVPWTQRVLKPVTLSVNWPPCGTQVGVTLVIEALEGVTEKPNWKSVAPPLGFCVSVAIIPPTLAFGLIVMFTSTLLAELTVILFTVISPVKSALIGPLNGGV